MRFGEIGFVNHEVSAKRTCFSGSDEPRLDEGRRFLRLLPPLARLCKRARTCAAQKSVHARGDDKSNIETMPRGEFHAALATEHSRRRHDPTRSNNVVACDRIWLLNLTNGRSRRVPIAHRRHRRRSNNALLKRQWPGASSCPESRAKGCVILGCEVLAVNSSPWEKGRTKWPCFASTERIGQDCKGTVPEQIRESRERHRAIVRLCAFAGSSARTLRPLPLPPIDATCILPGRTNLQPRSSGREAVIQVHQENMIQNSRQAAHCDSWPLPPGNEPHCISALHRDTNANGAAARMLLVSRWKMSLGFFCDAY